ncbi:MAG: nitrate- and nitrite sensing domain-containing protein, partial [Pseudomonadota bacterium]
MNLRATVALALALPVIAATVFFSMLISRDLSTANSLEERGSVVGLVAKASQLVHELQIERGRSLGAISGGYRDRFVQALQQQRLEVDAAKSEFTRFVNDTRVGAAVPPLETELNTLKSKLAEIDTLRREVDAERAVASTVIKDYTVLIKD